MSTKKTKRPWAVFFAIFLAMIVGSLLGTEKGIFGVSYYAMADLIGSLFLNSLMLVMVPLVCSSIITGISRIGNEGAFGRLGGKMFFFYLGTSLLAILIGLFFVNILQPGVGQLPPTELIPLEGTEWKEKIANQGPQALVKVLLSLVPSNLFAALSEGQMLGLIFFSIFFGYALSRIEGQPGSTVQQFFQGVFQAMIRLTQIFMKVLPFGVFCLVSKVFMTTGWSSLKSVSLFLLTVLLGLSVFTFLALPLLLKYIARVNPLYHFKAMAPALVTAFSTSSSSATLPVTIECVEKRAKVSNRICSLVVPLGTSINMSGSALYECVAAMFVAQVYGIEMHFATQFLVVLMSLITSIGVAGIPSASLVAIIIVLKVIGLPIEGVGLFIAVDRLLDMCRTTVNVFSDSCCAILVARTEGESDVLSSDRFDI